MLLGIVAIDVDATVRWFNPPAERILGLSGMDALNKPVEAVGHTNNNGHLAQAQAYPARSLPIGPGQLYWWEVNRVGAFYAYDGKDMVVVLMGRVSNPPTFGDLLSLAQGRV